MVFSPVFLLVIEVVMVVVDVIVVDVALKKNGFLSCTYLYRYVSLYILLFIHNTPINTHWKLTET